MDIEVTGQNSIEAFNAAAIAVLKQRGQVAEDAALADAQIAAICGQHRSAYIRWRTGANGITEAKIREIGAHWIAAGYPPIRVEIGADGGPCVARVEVAA